MNKTILSLLGVLSLIWIGYVGINMATSGDRILPETVFDGNDQSIVIVHKPLEPDYKDEQFAFLSKDDFYANILTHTERIQHFYFSSSRPLVLLERSKPWTIELIDRYFGGMGISSTFESAKTFKLANGWYATYDKEYLVLSKSANRQPTSSNIAWKYVDRKSSASILHWENGIPKIENAYRSTASEIRYISQTGTAGSHLADDQDIFQDVLPANFKNIEFFETHYLQTLDGASSPLYQWMDKGAVIVRSKNGTCIVTDCIPGQDPIAILGDRIDESSLSPNNTSGYVKSTALPASFQVAEDWYVETFNNRVFIASKKVSIDALIGNYETGSTLSQNEQLRKALFAKAPKRVSYRKISPAEHRTISLLDGSRHTVVQRYGGQADETETDREPQQEEGQAVRIDGGIAQIVPVQGSNFVYVLSKANELYGIDGEQQRWKIALSGPVIGQAALSYSGGELIVTTSEAVHQVTRGGKEFAGQPVKAGGTPVTAAVSYSWKGASQLAIVTERELRVFNTNGSLKMSMALPFAPANIPFVVWSNAGDLTATIAGKGKGINVSIDRKRKGKEFSLPEGDWKGVKTQNGPRFFGIQNGRFVSVSHKGEVTDLKRNANQLLCCEPNGNRQVISVLGRGKVYLYSEEGTLTGTVSPAFDDIAGCSVQNSASGKSVVGILDGIANKNYIYEQNGTPITTKSYAGGSVIALHRLQNGTLTLLSQSNDYLVRYSIEN